MQLLFTWQGSNQHLTKVTIMVNHTISQPFYSLTLIQALVEANHFAVVNTRAINRVEDLGWSSNTLKHFILALNASHFLRRYPQCSFGNSSRTINCDGYKMQFDEGNLIEGKNDGLLLFIKLALFEHSRTLIISFHMDGSLG
jgi:Motility quorum-sensing regulator, toxin of MqsA